MGSHAKPRTRVRSAAMGALTVGAALTGLGLTAAALNPADSAGPTADGALDGGSLGLAAAGLGAPVAVPLPVTDGTGSAGGSSASMVAPGTGAGRAGDGHVRGRPIKPSVPMDGSATATTAATTVASDGGGVPRSRSKAENAGSSQRQGQGDQGWANPAPTAQPSAIQAVEQKVTAVQSAVAPLLNQVFPLSAGHPAAQTTSPTSSRSATIPTATRTDESVLPALPALPALPGLPALTGLTNPQSAVPALPAAAPTAPSGLSGLFNDVTGLL